MRAEQRVKSGELKPAHVQLAGVILGGDETANVGTPKRDAAQAGIYCDGYVRLQSLPSGLDVARPQERGVSLHASVSIAVQSVNTLVRPIHLMALKIRPIARKPRGRVESIALIGPPAIHAKIEERFVGGPVAARLTIGSAASSGRS